jgi:hypothetical protein
VYQLKIDKNTDPAAAPPRGLCDSGRITYDCYQAVTSFPCFDCRSFGNYFLRLAVAVVSAAVPYLADPVDPFSLSKPDAALLCLAWCLLGGTSAALFGHSVRAGKAVTYLGLPITAPDSVKRHDC